MEPRFEIAPMECAVDRKMLRRIRRLLGKKVADLLWYDPPEDVRYDTRMATGT